jgi:branched-chain amino acid transport system ATP-binding protein
VLEVKDIHTYYGDSYILQGVSLKVDQGSTVGILGRNGVGKTTLIRSIIGFTPPRRGQVIFKGTDITHIPPHKIAKLGIGLVPQGRRVFKSLNVRENLTVTAMNRGQDWNLNRIYQLFPVLRERERQKAGKLSGGEQQMLATARGIRGEPELMLMDEPSEGLAPLMVRELGRIIRQLKAEGFSFLLVEQNFAFALKVVDYICVMSKGIVVYKSTPEELQHNEEIKSQYIGV